MFFCFLSGQCCLCRCIANQLKGNYGTLNEHVTNGLESNGLSVHNRLLLKNHFINRVVYFRFHFTRSKKKKQEVLGRTNRLLSLIRHGPHWKQRIQKFFYCVCIRYRGNVSIEPLPSNDRGIFTEPLSSNHRGIHRHAHTPTHTHTHGQQRDLIFIFLK
jgi:hypothetical protein